jgi:hypothetical protein
MSHDVHAAPTPRTGTIEVKGRTLALGSILGVEIKPAESWARNGFFLVTGLLCPVLSMIIFTVLDGPVMWAAGLITAAAPFIGLLATFAWKKPWGVVIEEPSRYRTIHLTGDRADAEQVAGQIRAALG